MRRVAVTGFGVVSPLGAGREAFFDSLAAGRSGIGHITRFDCDTFAVRLAGEVREPLDLPNEVARAARADAKIGFAWAAFGEAMRSAGLERLGGSTLLHLGTSLETFDLDRIPQGGALDARSLVEDGEALQTPLSETVSLLVRSFGRPALFLTNCSACAASAQAIGHGFASVRSGRFETAVCGGFDSMVNPLGIGGFQLLGALTADNDRGISACRPFDASRSGTVLGEGAAVLVLEPLEKARAAGKTIFAEVCGYGSSLDAHGLSAPDPEGDGAARAMKSALDDARLEPGRIEHINTHGTGTRLNDEIEAVAIRRVFKGAWERIPVSSTKALTGHLIGAAGAIEAGACLFAFARGLVPPHPFLSRVAPRCELFHAGVVARPFAGEYALNNSFGFGGQNACLVFRRADGRP